MDNRQFLWKAAATILFLGMITINALANILPLNGLTTGEISDLYPSLFTPAGYTFSIWSVIYLALFLFLVFSWIPNRLPYSEKIFVLFSISSFLNIAWVFVWHHLMAGLSVLIMIALLVTLALLFLHIRGNIPRSGASLWLIHIPFSIYFAWICVAIIANVSAYLVGIQWNGFGVSAEVWTIIMILVAGGLGVYFCLRFGSYEHALVVSWALIGILMRWLNTDQRNVIYTCSIAVALLIISTIYNASSRRITV